MGNKESWSNKNVYTGSTTTGKGLFTREAISKGKPVVAFSGINLTFHESFDFGADQCYSLQIGPNEYLHLDPPGKYVNHSCVPNCGIKDGPILVALRDIAEGEELTFDYSTTMLERCWEMTCNCGHLACRGVIRDFDLIPVATQIQYIRMDIVSRFILEMLASGDWEEKIRDYQAA